jgi:hypothetical protein
VEFLTHNPTEKFRERHNDFMLQEKLTDINIWVHRVDHVEGPLTFVAYLLGTWDRVVAGKQHKGRAILHISDEEGKDARDIGKCLEILKSMVIYGGPNI